MSFYYFITNLRKKLVVNHRYYLHSGLYKFVFVNTLKVVLVLALLFVLITVVERYIIDLDTLFSNIVTRVKYYWVFVFFFVSESLLGLIPPDLFIIWTKQLNHTYLSVCLLAALSYLGGIVSYYIGMNLRKLPRIKKLVEVRFARSFDSLRRWGPVFILIAALFPLPFAPVCVLVGITKMQMKRFLLFSLARMPRFFIYAYIFFEILKI